MVPNDYFHIKQIACQKDRNNAFRHKKRGIFVEKPLEKESIGNVPRFLLLSPIYIYIDRKTAEKQEFGDTFCLFWRINRI